MKSNSFFVPIKLFWLLLLVQLGVLLAHAQASQEMATIKPTAPERPRPTLLLDFSITNYGPKIDGKTDDTDAFVRCFAAVAEAGGGRVTIPPGDYYLAGGTSIKLCSNTHVIANGARFLLPTLLGDRARITLFQGEDVVDFIWEGGYFEGHCFDPARNDNTWEPNVHTKILFITTTRGGATGRLAFRGIVSNGIAGAVVAVYGMPLAGSDSEVDTFATSITVEKCILNNSGRFCWDYGYLWEILVWPEDYTALQQAHAVTYFPVKLVHSGVRFEEGGDRVFFDNRINPVPVSLQAEPRQMVCFFDGVLPSVLKRGKAYYVLESTPGFIRIANQLNGAALRFNNVPQSSVKIMQDMNEAYWNLLAPIGSGESQGGIDLRCCRNTRIVGCTLSAGGDTTHIERCYSNVFSKNHVTGSRMGALWLSSFCRSSDITDNIIEGTNGSRTLSVEKSNQDVRIIGNTFRGGGRGNWINQPRNIQIVNNQFIDNTLKGTRNPKLGRRTYVTGDYDSFSELYFTVYEPNGSYGGVVIRGNVFNVGSQAQHAIGFQRNGDGIEVSNNTFLGTKRNVVIDPTCTNVVVRDNRGISK